MTGDRVGAGGYLCWIGSDGFADGRGSGGKAGEIPPSGHFMDFFELGNSKVSFQGLVAAEDLLWKPRLARFYS